MLDPNAQRLLHYLTRKLTEHLDSLEHALDHMDAQGDANAVDLEYNRELLGDADNCLHGVLWIMDATGEDCGKNEAADVLAATRTLRWLGQRHNEYVDSIRELWGETISGTISSWTTDVTPPRKRST